MSIESKRLILVLGDQLTPKRGALAEKISEPGDTSKTRRSNSSLYTASRAPISDHVSLEIWAATPKPTMPATFSVPARKPCS